MDRQFHLSPITLLVVPFEGYRSNSIPPSVWAVMVISVPFRLVALELVAGFGMADCRPYQNDPGVMPPKAVESV